MFVTLPKFYSRDFYLASKSKKFYIIEIANGDAYCFKLFARYVSRLSAEYCILLLVLPKNNTSVTVAVFRTSSTSSVVFGWFYICLVWKSVYPALTINILKIVDFSNLILFYQLCCTVISTRFRKHLSLNDRQWNIIIDKYTAIEVTTTKFQRPVFWRCFGYFAYAFVHKWHRIG